MRIKISWSGGVLFGTLRGTPTTVAMKAALPYSAKAQVWGKEVYFSLPFDTELEADATDVVDPGTICYWVQGRSLALPYGPTPVSEGDECRLVTAVNILGKIEGDPNAIGKMHQGQTITVSVVQV